MVTQLLPLSQKWTSFLPTPSSRYSISQALFCSFFNLITCCTFEFRSKLLSHFQGPTSVLSLLDKQPQFWVQLDNHIHETPKASPTSLLGFVGREQRILLQSDMGYKPPTQVLTAIQGCSSVPRMTAQVQGDEITQVGTGPILVQHPHATYRRQHLLHQSVHECTPALSKKNTSVHHTTFKNAQSYGFPPVIYTSFIISQLMHSSNQGLCLPLGSAAWLHSCHSLCSRLQRNSARRSSRGYFHRMKEKWFC